MIQQCINPKNPRYARFGGRGISVCKRWRESFAAFMADMGPRPSPKHSVDRKKEDGDFKPSNCIWTEDVQQERYRQVSRPLTIGGETMTLAEWARRTGIARRTILKRLERGWSPAEAVGAAKR